MYYRRRGGYRRRYGMRRRRYGARTRPTYRRFGKSRGLYRPVMAPHSFKRTYQDLTPITYSSGVTYGAENFKLVDLPDVNEFQRLFDSYKISCIVLRVFNTFNSTDSGANVTDSGRFHWVLDYNDSNTPTSVLDLQQYGTYKVKPLGRCNPLKIVIRPKLSVEFYRSLATTGYGTMSPKWLDMTDTGIAIPHFGLKYAIEGSGFANPKTLTFMYTYYFRCKYTK